MCLCPNRLYVTSKCFKLVLILLCISTLQKCEANLNIFLTRWEVMRLLGISAELYYVRDGVINSYAMSFPVPVPAHISHLYFTWEALYNQKLRYSMNVTVSNKEAIPKPAFNISRVGTIPTRAETFELLLDCNNKVNAEVDVVFNINVTHFKIPANTTTLTFRRKKICLKEKIISESPDLLEVSGIYDYSYIATACACALLTTVATAIAAIAYYTHLKNKKVSRESERATRDYSSSNMYEHVMLVTRNTERFNTDAADQRSQSSDSRGVYTNLKILPVYNPPFDLDNNQNRNVFDLAYGLSIERQCVKLNDLILEGTFGRVYKGVFEKEDGTEEVVLVKTVAAHASDMQVKLLVMEGIKFHSTIHMNVLPVIGVALDSTSPPYVVFPYSNSTNLKRFLQKCKHSPEGIAHTLTTQEVVYMALQIICGMQFIHEEGIIHGDLAARNCVVDPDLKVRITDSALSRDLFPSDYHCLGDNVNRPIKWLAIESVKHNVYTIESDVWSFGVLLWELSTLAQQPYMEIDPFEMAAYLSDGYRLSQPVNCPDELFTVMAYCWTIKPEERPTLNQLYIYLQDLYAQLTKYV